MYEMDETQRREDIKERFTLSIERVAEIAEDPELGLPFADYFQSVAHVLLRIERAMNFVEARRDADGIPRLSKEEGEQIQKELYLPFTPGYYENTYLSPKYAVGHLGLELGGLLSAFTADFIAMPSWLYEGRQDLITIFIDRK